MHENILNSEQRHLASQLLPVFNHFYLCYFKDVDMTQTVAYLGKSPGNDEICQFLTHEALS